MDPWSGFYLALWGGTFALLPYALIRKKTTLFEILVVIWLMASLNVMIGIERPNPEMTQWVPVVTLGK